jgi:hypothetical protein
MHTLPLVVGLSAEEGRAMPEAVAARPDFGDVSQTAHLLSGAAI